MATEYEVWECRKCHHYWYQSADTCPKCSGTDIRYRDVKIEPTEDYGYDPEFEEMVAEEAERRGS